MTLPAWLFTITQPQESLVDATTWTMWTEPPRCCLTGEVRRRGDREPFTPRWSEGESVFIYFPDTGRICAWLVLEATLDYDEADELFYVTASVEMYEPAGPTLSEIGVQLAVQGGRQRLTPAQHAAAVHGLRQAAGARRASLEGVGRVRAERCGEHVRSQLR